MATGDPGTLSVDSIAAGKPTAVGGGRDIVFSCPNCQGELVVDRDGAGLSLPCPRCSQPLTIPDYQSLPQLEVLPPATAVEPPEHAPSARHFDFTNKPREELERRFNELKHQLKENRSQDTEMRGHVNKATMELHRLQLKLKKLGERHVDIGAEIHALAEWLDGSTP